MKPRKILVIQLRQLGDILLTTPVLRELKRQLPDAEITFLSHGMGNHVLSGNPDIDRTLVYHDSDSIGTTLGLLRSIHRSKFDLVLDFMNNPRSVLFAFASRAKNRVGFESSRSFVYTNTVRRDSSRPSDYIVREKFELLRAAGFQASDERLVMAWDEQHLDPVRRLCAEHRDFRDSPMRVVLSATHRRDNRKWPVDHYVALAQRLIDDWNASIVWTWGPGPEQEEVRDLAARVDRPQSIQSPATTFRELAALIANCDLFIGNSNGPSHVAVAVNTCSLQLHGHSNRLSWCPMNERHRGLQSSEFGAVANPTLDSLTFDEVWEALGGFQTLIERDSEKRREAGTYRDWSMKQASEMTMEISG